MRIFITGGTGFIGSYMTKFLLNAGHQVTVSGTRPNPKQADHPNFQYIQADTTKISILQQALDNVDTIINLAGRTIFHLWTASYKKEIYDSRILTTRALVNALPKGKDIVLFSTSAAGFYGDGKDNILTERAKNGDDFLAQVCRDWEAEAFRAEEKGVRVVIGRFGVVLGKDGGAIDKMIPVFGFGIGGPLGDGMHWFPWVHIEDLFAAVWFVVNNKDIKGAVNITAPEPVRNRDFAKALGKKLNRPAVMPAPAFLVRLVLGEFGSALLTGQRAVPEKLLTYGFSFKYPNIETALSQIISAE